MAIFSSSTGRARKWFVGAALILLAVLGWLAAVRWNQWGYERQGLALLATGDFSGAAKVLADGARSYPRDERLAFLAAVAFRRAGDDTQFEAHLRSADRLGLPDS